jgi:hypothetical protein
MTSRFRCVGYSLLLVVVPGGLAFGGERPTGETRRLTLERRPDWATAFHEIETHPYNWELRGKLAAQYTAAGYTSAGRFFRHRPGRDSSADLVREAATWATSTWRCSGDPKAFVQMRSVAEGISESVQAGRYGRAVDQATAALRDYGPRCELLVAWAEPVLYAAIARGNDKSADSEAAVRILITGVDDLNVQPVGLELSGPTGVYEFLSQYFCAMRDLVSCATALDFAIARLGRLPAAGAEEVDRWRVRLEKRRNSVLARLQAHR